MKATRHSIVMSQDGWNINNDDFSYKKQTYSSRLVNVIGANKHNQE